MQDLHARIVMQIVFHDIAQMYVVYFRVQKLQHVIVDSIRA